VTIIDGTALSMRRSALVACLFLLLISLLLVVTSTLERHATLAALAVIWVSAVPMFLYFQEIDRSPLPFAPYIGLYYLIFFGLVAFAAPLAFTTNGKVVLYHRIILEPIGPEVLLLVVAGVAMMFISFYVSRNYIFSHLPRFRVRIEDTDHRTLNWLYAILLISSLAFRYTPALQTLPSVGQFLDPVGYLALGGFYLQWRAGHLSRWVRLLILVAALPLEAYWRLRYLMITDFLLLGVFFAFVLWRRREFKALTAVIVFGTIVAFGYSATGHARVTTDSSWGRFAAIVDYVVAASEAKRSTDARLGGGTVSYDTRISRLVNRVGQIWVFQHVYQSSPDPVPYLSGETYRPLMTTLVPRLLYPDKPQERGGALFGHRYGFTESSADNTSFNIPWIVELLANFGRLGVLGGMAFFGLLLALLDKLFNAHGMSDVEFLIGLTMIFRLGYQESNFSVMTGSLPALFICLFVYFRYGPRAIRAAVPRSR
jgi:hypothetical protein